MKSRAGAISGVWFIVGSALLMSLGGVLIKAIPWSAMAVNGGRNLVAAATTFVYLKAVHHPLRLNKSVALCAASICVCCYAYTIAVRLTTAANAIVLEYTSPVFVIALMAVAFGKKPRPSDLLACAVLFVGIVCFFLDSLSAGGMAGNLLAIVAAATYSAVFLAETMPGADSLSSYFWAQLLGGLVGLPWIVAQPDKTPVSWAAILFMGVVQISLAYLCMSRGLRTTSPVAANLICMLEPVLNPVWVALYCGEVMGPFAAAGMVIVLAGLVVYNVYGARSAKVKEQ